MEWLMNKKKAFHHYSLTNDTGSVAQKKAFFEAHYKKIAAQKAASLLEQANSSTENTNQDIPISNITHDSCVNPQVHENSTVSSTLPVADMEEKENDSLVEGPGTPEAMEKDPSNKIDNSEAQETVSGSEISVTSHDEKPLLKMKGRMAVCNLACEGLTSSATPTAELAQRKLYIRGLSPDTTSEIAFLAGMVR